MHEKLKQILSVGWKKGKGEIDSLLKEWIISETSSEKEETTLMERVYIILHGKDNCQYNNDKKFCSFTVGYRYCRANCLCQREETGEKIKIIKGSMDKETMLKKLKATMIEKHGVENAQQSKVIHAKTNKTNLERYGGNPMQTGLVPIDVSQGQHIGIIQTGIGPLQVWKLVDQEQLGYAAVIPVNDLYKSMRPNGLPVGPKNPVAVLSFQVIQGVIIARNAYTNPNCRGKGIQSELFLFVNKVEGQKILSDTHLTKDGEVLWNSLIKSSKFNLKILYIPTKELFDLSDIGKAKTQDGETVDSPKNDSQDDGFYDASTKKGQRFFYLIESKERFRVEGYEMSVMIDRHKTLGNILQPYRYFRDGDL